MVLPVLRNSSKSIADLVRLFHQSQLEWSRHLGEETELDFGRWIHNPDLAGSAEANVLHDAFLIPDMTVDHLMEEMTRRCRELGVPWNSCSINPSMPIDQTQPIIDTLRTAGWTVAPLTILQHAKKGDGYRFPPPVDLRIIPSRAGYERYQQLIQQVGDAGIAMLHLDDSHVDSLLALRGTEPVGCISVLSSGETGTIRQWFVAPAYQRKGIGQTLLQRALEICARGQLRNVMMGLSSGSPAAFRLAEANGFQPIGEWMAFRSDLKS